MIPSFVKRLSSRLSLTRKPSDKKDDEADGRLSLARRSTKELDSKDDGKDDRPETSNLRRKSTLDKTPLSKRPTLQLDKEKSLSRRSSRQVTFQKSLSKKSSTESAPTKSLSKKLSSAGKSTSLTSKPILAGRAPSLTAHASKESMTKKTSVTGTVAKKKNPNEKTLWYINGTYVTVRNDDGSWFLCRLQHNVYNTSKSVKIRWLTQKGDDECEYKLDYRDEIDPACILFNVRVTRERTIFTLYNEDRLETDKLLKVAADVASGKLTVGDVDSEVEEVLQIEPPTKKRKTEEKKKIDGKKKKAKDKTSKRYNVKKAPRQKKEPKDSIKKEENKELKRKVAKKKVEEAMLYPKSAVTVHKKDPFFETSHSVPFISKYAHSRLVFRAVHMKDHKLLKKLIKETGKVRELDHWRSVADQTSALHHAITLKDVEAMKLLAKDFYSDAEGNDRNRRNDNTPADKLNVSKLQTGTYNYRFLGIDYIRPVMASRGGREGNNALTKDLQDMQEEEVHVLNKYLEHMLEAGIDFEMMQEMLADENFLSSDRSYTRMKEYEEDMKDPRVYSYIYFKVLSRIDTALERGHYKLAGHLLQEMANNSQRCRKKMSNLHYMVLISDKELKSLPPSQVTWGIRVAHRITPVHCAACNPDTQHLKKLLEMEADVHLSDRLNRRLIHFAAGCEGTGPLELLIKRGAKIHDCDRLGNIPLHFAVRANRLKNVQFLLRTAAASTTGGDDPWLIKYGASGISRPNKNSYTPLHIAAESGFYDIVHELVKNGANINATLNVTQFKMSPLILASQCGFFDTVVFLVENGAAVQQKDRLGRTAVIHAAMNGNTNVLSYLLNIGASCVQTDTSGNSPLHYAAAYGWYFCVKTLLEAGADVNASNDWKITPLSIAYMKSHNWIVTTLLEESVGDINFMDEAGRILLSTAVSSVLYPDLYDQIHYLVKDKGAICTFTDTGDATMLHQLAENDILLEGTKEFQKPSDEAMETSVKIAKLLIDHGCDPKAVNKKGLTAVMTAMRTGNIKLVKFLVKTGCHVITELDKEGDNILHHLCYDHMDTMKDYLSILCYAAETGDISGIQNLKQAFRDMAQVFSHNGATPLLAACQQYQVCEKICDKDDTDEDKAAVRLLWERGRQFIKFLIDMFGSDVNALVASSATNDNKDWGQWSVAESLAETKHCEYGGLREKDELENPALRMILEYKPNMNTRDREGFTPLTSVLTADAVVPSTLLVKESNADVNDYSLVEHKGKKCKLYGLSIAVIGEKLPLIELMLEAGADPNVKDERDGYHTLQEAIFIKDNQDSLKAIQMLLEHGAEVDTVTGDNRTALHLAVNKNAGTMDGNFDIILELIAKGSNLIARDTDGKLPLHFVFAKENKNDDNSQHDPVELCRIIASRMKPGDLNIQDKFGMTALHRAAFRGANICCMYLMQKGADVNLKNNDGNTSLAMAMIGGHDGCATLLIQDGACLKVPVVAAKSGAKTKNRTERITYGFSYDDDSDSDEEEQKEERPVWELATKHKDKTTANKKGVSLLEFALQHELQGVFFMLTERPFKESGITFGNAIETGLRLQKYNAVLRLLATTTDVTLYEGQEHGRNLLHVLSLTATGFDSPVEKVATELLEKGVSLTKEDDFKCTPLLYASLNQNFGLCKFYMSSKTMGVYKPKYTDSFGRSVISAAFWKWPKSSDSDFMSWLDDLHEKKASLEALVDCPIEDDLPWAVDKDWKADYWEKYDCVKVSPLITSIRHHNQKVTQWFLKKGVNVNLPDSLGRTPVMHAARVNDLSLVKTLLNYDFDPNAKEEEENKTSQEELTKSKGKKSRIFQLKPRRTLSQLSKGDDEEEEEEEGMEQDKKEEEEMKMETDENERPNYQPYKKVSPVNLNAVDKNGWTVMHHAVCPLSFGTFDNDEIVFILAKAGAKLNMKNKKGETPLDLAIKKGAFRIVRMIQELEKVNEKNRKEVKSHHFSVADNLKWTYPQPSFHEDAEKLMEKLGKPKDIIEENNGKIDTQCNVASTDGTLVKCEVTDLLYDVLLTKVDAQCRHWSMYSFYKMQLVYQASKDLYILFTRWGRIGSKGQYQHTPYKVKEDAVEDFSKIFCAKTGNRWMKIKSFENKPRKYHLVHITPRHQIQTDLEFDSQITVKCRLPEHLQLIMKEMINPKSMRAALSMKNTESGLVSFANLQRAQILKARDLLQKISVLADEVDDYRDKTRNRTRGVPSDLKEKYQLNCEQITALSNEYFQIMALKEFALENIRPLDCTLELTKQIKLVSNLLDYEVISHVMMGAKYREKETNPLDYVYQSVGCQIQLLSEEDEESQYILRYIKNTAPATQVEAIYRLEVKGEQARMDKKNLGNHRLLWYGSDTTNFLSILHRGLVIAPQDVAFTGHLYGQGIYFSDAFCKSSEYSKNLSKESKTCFMLLCEVAVGRSKRYVGYASYMEKVEKMYDSAFAMGEQKPVEHHNVTLPNGCLIPLGEMESVGRYYKGQRVCHEYNRYIVYDEGQVCLRYLIQYRKK